MYVCSYNANIAPGMIHLIHHTEHDVLHYTSDNEARQVNSFVLHNEFICRASA